MRRFELADEPFQRITHLLFGKPEDPGVTVQENRLVVDAVLGSARTCAPCRDLPERFSDWNSVYQRFNRGAKKGVWARVLETLGGDPDREWLLIDSTIVRAPRTPPGPKQRGAERPGVEPVAGRLQHHGARGRRRPRQPGPAESDGRAGGRRDPSRGVGGRP